MDKTENCPQARGGKVSACVAKAILNPGNWQSFHYGSPGPNTNTLTFEGIPTNQYITQFATNVAATVWVNLSTNTADANGRGVVIDSAATDRQRFYRIRIP